MVLMKVARIDDRDWSALTLGEQIRQIEVEGYLLMPNLLSAPQVQRLKSETARLETFPMPYSEHQLGPGASSGDQPVPRLQLGTLPIWPAGGRHHRPDCPCSHGGLP